MAVKTVNRTYGNFRGVDFSNSEVNLYRSPDSVNMWKNYDEGEGIETRPGMTLLGNFGSQIFGLFFYRIQNTLQVIVHAGTKLYKWNNYPNAPTEASHKTELYSGMKPAYSTSHVFNNILFIHDGLNYLEYDGTTCQSVVGTVPITRLGTTPSGAIYKDDVDYTYQDVNMLTNLRKNGFVADGVSTDYYLDSPNLDSATVYVMKATINGVEKVESVDFTVDRTNGIVHFNTAPPAPLEDGDSNVIITYSKTNTEDLNKIRHCTISVGFDNRIFFSGNPNYPNTVFHTELEDPRYVSTNGYTTVGLDVAAIKVLIPGNNVLWVFKETVQNDSNVFLLTPTVDYQLGKIYPSETGNISTGCVSTGVNFNDDICFFSRNGLEAIGKNLGNDQILVHRSSLVDSKLISDTNYTNIKLAEYRGYLMCLLGSKVFLADSRALYEKTSGKPEYEWFYWELPNNVNYLTEYQHDLYLANSNGEIYILEGTDDDTSEITIGKNKFDYEWFYEQCVEHNCTKELMENGIKLTFTAGADAYIGEARNSNNGTTQALQDIAIKVKPSTTYTLSASSLPNCYLTYMNSDKEVVNTSYISITSSYTEGLYTFTTPNNVEYIGLRFGISNNQYTEWEFTNIQLEEGNEATEYEPYTETPVALDIQSKWATTKDTFGYDSYRKITNKRGGTASVKIMNNDSIKLKTKTEIREHEIGTYDDEKGYIVYRVKEKKFKWIQFEFSSNKPFGLFSCTIEAFIGGYVKR